MHEQGEEIEAYIASGVVTHAGLAFSRDGKEKSYIQHKMTQVSPNALPAWTPFHITNPFHSMNRTKNSSPRSSTPPVPTPVTSTSVDLPGPSPMSTLRSTARCRSRASRQMRRRRTWTSSRRRSDTCWKCIRWVDLDHLVG